MFNVSTFLYQQLAQLFVTTIASHGERRVIIAFRCRVQIDMWMIVLRGLALHGLLNQVGSGGGEWRRRWW
jgi:hypothetical protein